MRFFLYDMAFLNWNFIALKMNIITKRKRIFDMVDVNVITCTCTRRLISVEDVRNDLSHIIYILIFDFFLKFLLFVRLQTSTSSRCWKEVKWYQRGK